MLVCRHIKVMSEDHMGMEDFDLGTHCKLLSQYLTSYSRASLSNAMDAVLMVCSAFKLLSSCQGLNQPWWK